MSDRLRLLIVDPMPTLAAMLVRIPRGRQTSVTNRFHRMTDAHLQEAIRLCQQSGWLSEELEVKIVKVSQKCEICTKSGFLNPCKKVPITHVSEALNQEYQIDYPFLRYEDKNSQG